MGDGESVDRVFYAMIRLSLHRSVSLQPNTPLLRSLLLFSLLSEITQPAPYQQGIQIRVRVVGG